MSSSQRTLVRVGRAWQGGWATAGVWRAGSAAVVVIALVVMVGVGGCRKKQEYAYSQATPQAVLDSMVKMIKEGQVQRLPDLIYAESKEFRIILNRAGGLMQRMQELTVAVSKRFPAEAAALKKKVNELTTAESLAKLTGSASVAKSAAKDAAKDASKKVAAAVAAGNKAAKDAGKDGGGAGKAGGTIKIELGGEKRASVEVDTGAGERVNPAERRDAVQQIVDQLLADPFAMLEANAARLTVQSLADDQAAILFDGKPIPPLGMTMRKENDSWFIELPTNVPGLSQYLPETRNEWSIMGSLIKALDNAVGELRDDVNAGKVKKVEQLAEKAGEKAFVPMAIIAVVYAKEMDVRNQRQKAMAELRPRLDQWAASRKAAGEPDEVTKKLMTLVTRAGVEGLDKAVRVKIQDGTKTLPVWKTMSDGELQGMIETWLDQRSVKLSIALPADVAAIDKAYEKLTEAVNVQKK